MYESYDVRSSNYIKTDDLESNHFETQEGVYDNVHSSEENFRGFEKVPIVLCQRLDITPYLNEKVEYPLASENMIANDKLNDKSLEKLLHSCSVVMVRDDLDKLKEMVKNSHVTGIPFYKCKICDKAYTCEKDLQYHQESKHTIVFKSPNKIPKRVSFSDNIIVHEVKEYHRCRKCPRIFEDYNSLRVHMTQQHKERKSYICFYCSKDFVDRMFFKVHIKLHCDSCGLLLANKKKYLDHRRYVCKIIKKYDCKTCNMSLFNYMDLKDHSYDHLGMCFICDICKDQLKSRCAVAHHIKFLHTKKRPKELYSKQILGIDSVYICNFCEQSFIERDAMEQHVSALPDLQNRVMTGYKDYYFCDQCLKKFNTETDMLQHKWTHYLKASDNSQLRKDITESDENIEKITYKVDEKLPDYFKPKLVLEKVKIPKEPQVQQIILDGSHFDANGRLRKAVVDPVTKKTIISKHQCQHCNKYLSSGSNLTRHLQVVHAIRKEKIDENSLQCRMCEEVFVWPWLLQNHRCIRAKLPEMPFDDARPEVHFDNVNEINGNGFGDTNLSEDENYMNSDDFEIPAPIVQLTEYEHLNIVVNGGGQLNVINEKTIPLNNLGYKLVMQEVPIEF